MFDLKKTYLMGILNVTPDSFSDGNKYFDKNKAVNRAFCMIKEGADIIDIGGESTRPSASFVREEIELDRVCEVIYKIRKNSNVIISIDTYKSKVAMEAIRLGADIVNDISGGIFDPKILNVAKETNKHICLTHNRVNFKNEFKDVVNETLNELKDMKQNALNLGIDEKKIILDPGIGFSKYKNNNVCILRELKKFKELNQNILIGVSRKKFLSDIANMDAKKYIESTLAITAYSILNGVNIIRVHDVKENKIVIDTIDKLIYGGSP